MGFPNERLLAPGGRGKRCVRSEGPLGGSSFGVWVRGFMELGLSSSGFLYLFVYYRHVCVIVVCSCSSYIFIIHMV